MAVKTPSIYSYELYQEIIFVKVFIYSKKADKNSFFS